MVLKKIIQIGQDVEVGDHSFIETFGLDPVDGPDGSFGAYDAEQCISWLGNGAYFDPEIPECFFTIGDAYNLWNR